MMTPSRTCCSDCPLACIGARGFVPDDIPAGAEYIFRGEAPGTTEIDTGKPFTGKAGFVLRNWLIRAIPKLQLALEQGKVGFSNNLHCLPPEMNGRPYPTGETKRRAEEHCAKFTQWPDSVHTVILCGEHPQRFYFSEELEQEDTTDRSLGRDAKGVMGRVGRVYEASYCFKCQKRLKQPACECGGETKSLRWVFAPHPAFILRQPALVSQGQEALKIAAGVEELVEPEVVRWEDMMAELNKE